MEKEKKKDKEIRAKLIEWLNPLQLDELSIREEMPIAGTRIDVSLFTNERIYGFEIKGDTDSFSRLQSQIMCYDNICDYSYIVVSNGYLEKVENRVPLHWGIIFVDDDVKVIRQARLNDQISFNQLLDHLVWKTELVRSFKGYGVNQGMGKSFIVNRIIELASPKEIKTAVCQYARNKRFINN